MLFLARLKLCTYSLIYVLAIFVQLFIIETLYKVAKTKSEGEWVSS